MALNSKLSDERFWKIVSTLDSLNQDVSLEELLHHLGKDFKGSDVLDAASFLKRFGFPLNAEKREGKVWLTFKGRKPRFTFDFSLGEWLAMQAHFPLLEQEEETELRSLLTTKLKILESKYPEADLFKVIEEEEELIRARSIISADQEGHLKEINRASLNNELVIVEATDGNRVEVFLHKVVYLDGILSIIGEDTNDRCLICLNFDQIEALGAIADHRYQANFAGSEIDDFITAIRSISGNEERLVLRISSPEKVNLKPQFHFLGNPYVTTNTEGEFIWAASVEVSDELFKWLEDIKDEIEILDPKEVREDFQQYLHERESPRPLKKAS